MTNKKLALKKSIWLPLMICIVIVGCQKTPDKSSVVSKADGLSKEIIMEPLKNGENRETDIPEHWAMSEKKSNDRVTISAELELGRKEIGNLPVIEMKNHVFSEEQLKNLVFYFAGDEKLYVPQIRTKKFYQDILGRAKNKEGAYGDSSNLSSLESIKEALNQSIELAPDEAEELKKSNVNFQKKTDEPAYEVYTGWWKELGEQETKGDNAENYFSADVGEMRIAHIDAETYDSSLGNSSSFSWKTGAEIITESFIQQSMVHHAFVKENGLSSSDYVNSFNDILNQYEIRLEQEFFDKEEGEDNARKILKDLGIKNMEIESSEKVLWFPEGTCPSMTSVTFLDDVYWQANLNEAQEGYQYTFALNIEGISAMRAQSLAVENASENYSPPFPVETIRIVVTNDGVKYFAWTGMAEEVKTIAENTKLIPFDSIQKQLIDQIFYVYSSKEQPAEDKTTFSYNVTDANMIYTYIPAYKEPANAWLVPAWYFVVEGDQEYQTLPFMIDALDGRAINQ